MWKRVVSTRYKMREGNILSRDETKELNITIGDNVIIDIVYLPQCRNWKERIILQINK